MSAIPNTFEYSAAVWQRFNRSAHAGRLHGPGTRSAEAGSVAARSLLRLQLRETAGKAEARFQAYGCPTAIAVGEWLCERIEALGLPSLAGLRAPDIRQALEISEDRIHCALMGEDVIKALLRAP